MEELTPGGSKLKRDQESRSEEFAVKKKRSESGLPVVITKPTLYQAIRSSSNKSSVQSDSIGFEWQAMGVYDDEDLIEVSFHDIYLVGNSLNRNNKYLCT